MYSCKLGSLPLLLALSASHHFILLHCQESGLAPGYGEPPPPPPTEYEEPPTPPPSDYGELLPLPPPAPAQAPIGLIAGAAVIGVVLIVGLFAYFFIWRNRRRRQSAQPQPQPPIAVEDVTLLFPPSGLSPGPPTFEEVAPSSFPERLSSLGPKTYTYEELKSATNDFSDSNFLGKGSFGTVHKGVLPDGQCVAIKRLNLGIEQAQEDFLNEITVINHVRHRHLVSFIGHCIDEARSNMMLVFEFVPNKTLAFHLHEKGTGTLDWTKRMKIAIGSAKGLAYLHEGCQPKIIHRDIKATNILVDDEFEPKVADFGLAKFLFDPEISTRIMGTFGYLAPEYADTSRVTEKADVFSFGVVLLELITGRKPGRDGNMVEWARPLFMEAFDNAHYEGIADERLENDYDDEEMFRMISCAANCVRHSATNRPQMSKVVQALEGAIWLQNDMTGERPAMQQLSEDMNKIRKMAMGSFSITQSDQPTTSSSGSKGI